MKLQNNAFKKACQYTKINQKHKQTDLVETMKYVIRKFDVVLQREIRLTLHCDYRQNERISGFAINQQADLVES